MVDELDEHLHARGYSVDRLHGDITQAQRTRVMDKFRRRGFEFLVATDVAARGLDVDDLEVVFNFDLPNDAEDYTHRIGRTGRAGKHGMAFTFVAGRELYKLQNMIHYGRLKIRRERVPSMDEVEEARGNVFFERIRATLDEKKFKSHDQMVERLLQQGYTSTDIASALIHLLQGAGEEAPTKAAAPGKSRAERIAENETHASAGPVSRPAAAGREASPPIKPSNDKFAEQKRSFDRKPRTGREEGFTTINFNVGRSQLITPADLVGKIAGVTRLPANVVGAIDIHEEHTLVDVATQHAELVVTKLAGIRIKNQSLKPVIAS
jgi:ATP-dependent RNA helicase DeaD